MPDVSHVHLVAPEQASLNRWLREGGAQLFPQWLSADPGPEPRIAWWGIRGAIDVPDVPDDPARAGLFPRAFDDWTESPRGLIVATLDADRAAADLEPALGADEWRDAGEDPVLGARCRRRQLGRAILVLAEPATEGYLAACLAQFGEGPVAVALDGTTAAGRAMTSNPVTDGPATWVHLGPKAAPYLLFLPAR
jgi:hypothetical protein